MSNSSPTTLADRIMPVYDRFLPFFTLTLLWVALSLPIIPLIPATAALLYAMNRQAHGRIADWSLYFEGLRRWFARSYLWGGLNLLVIGGLALNIAFYSQVKAAWSPLPTILAAFVLALWLVLQVTTFPLLLQQEKPSLRLALRNSLVLLARRPLRVLGGALLIAAIALFSTFVFAPAWLFLSASLIAYIANRATLAALRGVMQG